MLSDKSPRPALELEPEVQRAHTNNWPLFAVRCVLLWLLRAFILLAVWNEIVRPLLLLSVNAPDSSPWLWLQTAHALFLALLVSAAGLDRPLCRPIQLAINR